MRSRIERTKSGCAAIPCHFGGQPFSGEFLIGQAHPNCGFLQEGLHPLSVESRAGFGGSNSRLIIEILNKVCKLPLEVENTEEKKMAPGEQEGESHSYLHRVSLASKV